MKQSELAKLPTFRANHGENIFQAADKASLALGFRVVADVFGTSGKEVVAALVVHANDPAFRGVRA
jgi:hypothetical protein